MSGHEELRQEIVKTANTTLAAWTVRRENARTLVGFTLETLRETDMKMGEFAEHIAQALRIYEKQTPGLIADSIEGIGKGHERLARALEGATHPDAIEGLQKIGQARQASTEILPGIGQISESIAPDLAAKVEAVRAVLRLAQVQISNPELTRDEAAAIARTLAPGEQVEYSMDAETSRHVDNGTNELNLFIQEM